MVLDSVLEGGGGGFRVKGLLKQYVYLSSVVCKVENPCLWLQDDPMAAIWKNAQARCQTNVSADGTNALFEEVVPTNQL